MGFERSLVWWLDRGPWPNRSGAEAEGGEAGTFEDWYLVKDWAAVGELNQRAVRGEPEAAHRAVAGLAGPGAGAIYELRAGELASAAQPGATWINKPRELTYLDFEEMLDGPLSSPGTGLWQRQLVLGPAPEFCLLSPAPVSAPIPVERIVARRRLR